MKTLKLFFKILLFVDMFITWFFIITLGMIFLAEWLKQYYFIRDMITILETSSNKENLGISIYTIFCFNIYYGSCNIAIYFLYEKRIEKYLRI